MILINEFKGKVIVQHGTKEMLKRSKKKKKKMLGRTKKKTHMSCIHFDYPLYYRKSATESKGRRRKNKKPLK